MTGGEGAFQKRAGSKTERNGIARRTLKVLLNEHIFPLSRVFILEETHSRGYDEMHTTAFSVSYTLVLLKLLFKMLEK